MNTRIHSQILAAMLVFAATTTPLVPTFAADHARSTAISSSAVQSNDTALTTTVDALLKNGDIKGATDAVNQALKANSSNATAYLCRSWVLYADYADLNQVIEPINKAISLDPTYIDARFARASVLKQMNDYRASAKEYDAIVALDNTNAEAMNASIQEKVDLQDWNGLISNFNIKIQNNQNDAQAYFNRAYCEAKVGQRDQAIADLEQAQKLYVAAKDDANAKAVADTLTELQKTT